MSLAQAKRFINTVRIDKVLKYEIEQHLTFGCNHFSEADQSTLMHNEHFAEQVTTYWERLIFLWIKYGNGPWPEIQPDQQLDIIMNKWYFIYYGQKIAYESLFGNAFTYDSKLCYQSKDAIQVLLTHDAISLANVLLVHLAREKGFRFTLTAYNQALKKHIMKTRGFVPTPCKHQEVNRFRNEAALNTTLRQKLREILGNPLATPDTVQKALKAEYYGSKSRHNAAQRLQDQIDIMTEVATLAGFDFSSYDFLSDSLYHYNQFCRQLTNKHGGLKKDAASPQGKAFEDGTPYFGEMEYVNVGYKIPWRKEETPKK